MIAVLAAAWILLHYKVGSGLCTAITAERNTGSGWTAATLYADRGTTIKRPRVAESDTSYADSAFVSVTQSGVGTSVRCRCVNGPASNAIGVVPPGSFPRDTTLYAYTSRPNVPALLGGGANEARWVSPDSSFIMIETLDAEQSRRRLDHLRACGYWWWHGQRRTEP